MALVHLALAFGDGLEKTRECLPNHLLKDYISWCMIQADNIRRPDSHSIQPTSRNSEKFLQLKRMGV